MNDRERQQKRTQLFLGMKRKHPDALLLLRAGDWYHVHGEDAKALNEVCGITVEKKRISAGAKMGTGYFAKFRGHELDIYLPKLVRAGKRVAICDGVENPDANKKPVKRGITESMNPAPAAPEPDEYGQLSLF